MNNTITHFDVLIVYSHKSAKSASQKKPFHTHPFCTQSKQANYNKAYSYLLQMCSQRKIKAAFTTTKDLSKKGYFKSYWLYKKNMWVKVQKKCSSNLIFDKFSPTTKNQKERRKQLFSNIQVRPFNCPNLFSLFFDKQKTYNTLSRYAIPTVSIKKSDQKNITTAFKTLTKLIASHPNSTDFADSFIIKDRFGAGGTSIYKVGSKNTVSTALKIVSEEKSKQFIIQPFTNFDLGYSTKDDSGCTDIRLIYMNSKIIQSYIRVSAKNSFLCNEHKGAKLKYIKEEDIPLPILSFSKKIINKLEKSSSLFALDYVISNNGNVYLMEGNTGPGLDWNPKIKKNERNAKMLINKLADQFASYLFSPKPFAIH